MPRSVEYWGGLQGDGTIEDYEVAIMTPHGGDLQGLHRAAQRPNATKKHRGPDSFLAITGPRFAN